MGAARMNEPERKSPVRAGVYLRVSTEEQRERQSIATQREFAERFCQLHGVTLQGVYTDDGVSGTISLENRPGAEAMLEDARRGKFGQLLVYKLDRLGRETRLILNAVAELEQYGVRVRSMTEEFDTATSTGRLMLTMLSGFAAHEREVIRERSLAGTNRVAETGAWLGGIVPYGYRKVGEKSAARLVICEDDIDGIGLSEADVIRMIYRMAAVDKKSCFAIADHLNALGVPCAYVRDGRCLLRGKRKVRTSGLWRPGRVRNLIVNATYMGRHEYGKRSNNPGRKIIVRAVPAIVKPETWKRAQEVLRSNLLFSKRNAKNRYLLRGLIKCGLCNLTYIGMITHRSATFGGLTYYRCNGKHGTRGLYGKNGQRCPSKDIRGDRLEEVVWGDIEGFLRNPGSVLEQLRNRLAAEHREEHNAQSRTGLQAALKGKTEERARVLTLFRRGRINDAHLDAQLKEIAAEEEDLRRALDAIDGAAKAANQRQTFLASVGDLLTEMRASLDEGVSWELKRRLIEILVDHIRIDTEQRDGVKRSTVRIGYRFPSSASTCTGTDSWRRRE